jgi:protein-tyrosine phosphatase
MFAIEMIPNLWIGDIRSIQDLTFLDKTKFTVIMNCTTKYDFPNFKARHIRIPVRDRGIKQDFDMMYSYLIQSVPEIYNLLESGERILIHCYAGRHRSVALVSGFLMKYGNLTLKEVIDTVQSKWKRIGFNFKSSLERYEMYLHNNSSAYP